MVDGVLEGGGRGVDTTSLLVCQEDEGGGSPSLYAQLEMLAGCLWPFPLDFPHEPSPSVSGS